MRGDNSNMLRGRREGLQLPSLLIIPELQGMRRKSPFWAWDGPF